MTGFVIFVNLVKTTLEVDSRLNLRFTVKVCIKFKFRVKVRVLVYSLVFTVQKPQDLLKNMTVVIGTTSSRIKSHRTACSESTSIKFVKTPKKLDILGNFAIF